MTQAPTRSELEAQLAEAGQFFQGPFDLADGLTVTGISDCSHKWAQLIPRSRLPADLAGLRVLEIGCNAGYDSIQIHRRHPEQLISIEPAEYYYRQNRIVESVHQTGVDFRNIRWQDLPRDLEGTFDIVFCLGIVYHEEHPTLLIETLHRFLKPGGLLLMESHVLREEHLSPYARFVASTFFGNDTYWWVPGRACLQNMLRRFGFDEVEEFFYEDSPYSINPNSDEVTIEGFDKGGLCWLQAVRSTGDRTARP